MASSALSLDLGGAAAESWRDRPFTWIASVLDGWSLRAMCALFQPTLRPTQEEIAVWRASSAPYLDASLQADPRRFFDFPTPTFARDTVRVLGERAIDGGRARTIEMDVRYVPWCDGPHLVHGPENDRVLFEHWQHPGNTPRRTMVAVHGFTMGTPWIDAEIMMVPHWFALGWDVVLPTLPFHGARSPRTARFSGELFGTWHVGRLNEAVRQSVHDLQWVIAWLRARCVSSIGLVGLSLGGYLTALLASLDPALTFAIPVAAPLCLGALPSRLFRLHTRSERLPLARETQRAAYRVHSPLAHELAIPRHRVLLVGGRGDRIVPPSAIESLWNHWGHPPLHWFRGGHTTPFGRHSVRTRIRAHIAAHTLPAM